MRFWNRIPGPAALMATAALLLAAPGCSSGPVPLYGEVTFDGQPIDDGTITFVPDGSGSDRMKAAASITNGKYKFDEGRGPMPGKYKVEIGWLKKTGRKLPTGDGEPRDEKVESLPEKFNKATTLTADVKSGEKKLDFQLKS